MSDTDLALLGIDVDATKLDQGKQKLNQFETAAGTAERATHLLKDAVKLAAEAFGTIKLAEFVRDITEAGIRAETLGIAMRVIGNNAGYTLAQMQDFQKQVQAFNYSSNEAGNILTKLAAAQIDVSQSAKLAGEAQGLATIANISSAEAFDNLTSAILSGRAVMLRHMGLAVDFTTSQLKLAQSLGETTEELTETQKIQSNLNAVLEKAPALIDLYKESVDTAGGKIRTLKDNWEELLTELGKDVLPGTTSAIGALADAVKFLNEQFEHKDDVSNWANKIEDGLIALLKSNPATYNLGKAIEYLNQSIQNQNKSQQEQIINQKIVNDYQELAAIAAGKLSRAEQDKADADAKRLSAQKEAAKSAQEYIEELSKELIAVSEGDAASKRYAITLEAMKAPTKELGAAIKELGDQLLISLDGQQIEKINKEGLLKLNELIQSTQQVLRHPENELLSLKSINDPNGPKAQGTGSGKTLIDNNPLPFNQQQAEAYLEILQRVQQQTQSAAQGMAAAFGSVGKAVGDLSTIMGSYDVQRQEIEVKRLAEYQKTGDLAKANAQAEKENSALSIQYQGDVIGATKEFFNQKSTIYKALNAAETVYRAIQLAGALQNIAAQVTETSATVANAGTQASAWGIVALARALASAPPPWNFVYMAAVGAALAGIGVAISGGQGGAAPGATDASDRQKVAGTGTVLGDASTKSDSITKAISDATKNSNQMLEYNSRMATSLKSIETNISSFTALIARNVGVSGGAFDTSGLGLGAKSSTLFGSFGSFFGLKTLSTNKTVSQQDFGLDFKSQDIASVVAGNVLGNVYQQLLTSSSTNLLGVKIGSSKSVSTVNSAITNQLSDQVVKIVSSLKDGVLSAASVLGLTGANAVIDSFKVNLGKLSFQDLTGQQIQDELNAVFGKLGDQLATELIPTLANFQQVGEGAFDTLARLAREYQVVDVTLASFGATFSKVGVASIAARDNLIKASGGMDSFTSQVKFFVDNFLTPAQQLAPIAKSVTAEMARLNQSAVTTKQQFANLVQSLDLATENGQNLFAALMNVAPAFNEVANAAEKTFSDLVAGIAANIDTLITASQDGAKAAAATAQAYTSVSQQLSQTLAQITSGTAANSLSALRRQFSGALSSGDLTSLQSLPGLATSIINAAKTQTTSLNDYRAIRNSVTDGLRSAGIVADAAAQQAAYQQKLYDVQTQILQAVKANVTSANVNTELLRQQISELGTVGELIDASGKGTIDSLTQQQNIQTVTQYVTEKGTITLGSVLASLNNIADEIDAQVATTALLVQQNTSRNNSDQIAQAAVEAVQAANDNANVSAIAQANASKPSLIDLANSLGYHGALFTGRGNAPILDVQQAIVLGLPVSDASFSKAGVSAADVARLRSAGVRAFAGGGFTSGLRLVGENGPEIENSGPSYVTGNTALKEIFDLAPLIKELQQQRTINAKNQDHLKRIRDLLVSITRDGDRMQVTTKTEDAA